MGSCSSAKKNTSHSQPVNRTKNTIINERKASSSTAHLPNGGSHVNGHGYETRKSVKLKELDRISQDTILDGNLFL